MGTPTKSNDPWKSRILGTGIENPAELLPNPHNWRTHAERQKYAVRGVLNEVGWVQSVTVNKRTGRLVDGHLRVALAIEQGATEIPVSYIDLSEEEEMLVLATLDPLTEMAGIDPEALAYVLENIQTEDVAVQSVLDDLAEEAGLGAQAQEDDAETASQIAKEISYKYELVFDGEDEMRHFYRFLKYLRIQFPDSDTVPERLVRYILELNLPDSQSGGASDGDED